MREKKFRGKRTSNGKWVYGYFVKCDGGYYIVFEVGETTHKIQVAPESVGQQVIVKGKEFYEGDVTKDDSSNIGVVRFGELPLDKSGDCVCTYPAFYIQCLGQLGQAPPYACEQLGEWMEIIGTIHTTHPELLEKPK